MGKRKQGSFGGQWERRVQTDSQPCKGNEWVWAMGYRGRVGWGKKKKAGETDRGGIVDLNGTALLKKEVIHKRSYVIRASVRKQKRLYVLGLDANQYHRAETGGGEGDWPGKG